jgi:hypothetical protein
MSARDKHSSLLQSFITFGPARARGKGIKKHCDTISDTSESKVLSGIVMAIPEIGK